MLAAPWRPSADQHLAQLAVLQVVLLAERVEELTVWIPARPQALLVVQQLINRRPAEMAA
jgi:hypothetical protein